MNDQCDFPRCKNLADFGYITRNICTEHWEQLCQVDSKTEKRLLNRIDLIRNKDGAVVLISKNKIYNFKERIDWLHV